MNNIPLKEEVLITPIRHSIWSNKWIDLSCLDHAYVNIHWTFWPATWQLQHAPFKPIFYYNVKNVPPKQEHLIIPTRYQNIQANKDEVAWLEKWQFSLILFKSKQATNTCSDHTHYLILFESHSTKSRALHPCGNPFNNTTQNGQICLNHARNIFNQPFDQQYNNWNTQHSCQSSHSTWITFCQHKSFSLSWYTIQTCQQKDSIWFDHTHVLFHATDCNALPFHMGSLVGWWGSPSLSLAHVKHSL